MKLENEEFQKIVLEQLRRLSDGQERLEARLKGVEDGQLKLEARIENEVIEKIQALFDDREVQNDRFENLEKRMEHLENQVEGIAIDTRYLVTRLIRLEKAVK